jgi:hypothetical protein
MDWVKAKNHFLTGLFVIMTMIVCSPVALWASMVALDFNMDATHPDTAYISYESNVLTGENISVDSVKGIKTPLHAGSTLAITNGLLKFTATGGTGNTTSGWTFSGGTIAITGDFNGSGNVTLLSGNFNTAKVSVTDYGFLQFDVLWGGFTDQKHKSLTDYYFGYAPAGFVGGINLSFTTEVLSDNSFSTTDVGSGDVMNYPVPLPGALWLFGAGLIGLVGVRRKIRR